MNLISNKFNKILYKIILNKNTDFFGDYSAEGTQLRQPRNYMVELN